MGATTGWNPHLKNTKSETVSTEWTVRTTKDLKVSNLFFLSIFLEGETGAQSNSHYFNISVPKSDADATTTTSVSKSASATISIDSTSTSTPTSASQSSPSPPSSPSIELGTGAKVGIGIGAAAALALGVMIGWLLFGRKKKQTGQVSTGLGLSGRYYDVGKSLHTDYPFKAELPAAAMMHELPATPLPHRQPQ
ncbi:hypothetical protein FQN55_000207 [Onygenales sp. PD_40]|nr:hypothetical protein FQN55_000207 [Onygenales sp. PD_40]